MLRVPAMSRRKGRLGLRQSVGPQRIAVPVNISPPIGGWNARDSLESMDQRDAVSLSNWFPRQSDVVSRPGYDEHCDTDVAATVQNLIPYEYAGTEKLLACMGGEIHEVSTGTTSSLGTGFLSNLWVHDILDGTLIMANGSDTVQNYAGSTIANNTFTGPTLADLNFVKVYKERVFAVEKNSTSMWYGGVNAISGAMTEFNFAQVTSVKGKLMLLATITGDGGEGGNDDIFLAIFSGGTVIAYTGSDPGDVEAWRLLGTYKIGRPLSRFGVMETDADVIVLTTRGYEQLGRMLKSGDSAKEADLISAKIQRAVQEEIKSIGPDDGWRIFIHPVGQMLMVVVPRTGDARHIHVRNVNTKAWCRFDDIFSYSWALLGTQPYFGGADGIVYKFDDNTLTDDGAAVRCDAQPAWNFLRKPGYQKQITLVRPYFKTEVYPSVAVATGADFNPIYVGEFGSADTGSFAEWDTAEWDEATWSPDDITYSKFYHRPALGDAIGMRVTADVTLSELKWNMTRVYYKPGGLL